MFSSSSTNSWLSSIELFSFMNWLPSPKIKKTRKKPSGACDSGYCLASCGPTSEQRTADIKVPILIYWKDFWNLFCTKMPFHVVWNIGPAFGPYEHFLNRRLFLHPVPSKSTGQQSVQVTPQESQHTKFLWGLVGEGVLGYETKKVTSEYSGSRLIFMEILHQWRQ